MKIIAAQFATAGQIAAIVGVVVFIVIAYTFFRLPITVAERRNHKDKGVIIAVTFCSLLLWPLWVAAVIWAYSGEDRSVKALAAKAGTYRAMGVMKSTGEDASILIEAGSEANARVKAELLGMVVTEMRFEPQKQTRAFPVVPGTVAHYNPKKEKIVPVKPAGYTGAKSMNFPE